MPILFDDRWDAAAKKWQPGKKIPTLEQGVKKLKDDRTVNENSKSGLVTLAVEAYTPELAAQWANGMIDLVNERLREADIIDREEQPGVPRPGNHDRQRVELRQAISHLIEQQINSEMLAEVQRTTPTTSSIAQYRRYQGQPEAHADIDWRSVPGARAELCFLASNTGISARRPPHEIRRC